MPRGLAPRFFTFKKMMSLRFFLLSIPLFFICCNNNSSEKKETLAVATSSKIKEATDSNTAKFIKNAIDSSITKKFILGKFSYKKHPKFIKTKPQHSSKTIYLDSVVYNAFKNMYASAKQDTINLTIISGTRNFYEQKGIWERKWKKYAKLQPFERAKKILEYSSMPTTSRHHWGTDIDINNLNNSYFENGKGKKEYNWLIENGHKFGFYQVYTNKANGRKGYNLEKWHWSYLPLSHQYLNYYNNNITYKDINGFKGAELAKDVKMIADYVNGIANKAKAYTIK